MNELTASLDHDGVTYRIWDLSELACVAGIELAAIPFTGRILLEALMRSDECDAALTAARRLAAGCDAGVAIAFRPSRLVMQDYTGVPSLVDLAALRDRISELGGDPRRVSPLIPTALVVDHSLQVDAAGSDDALATNEHNEMSRNRERYSFLRWAESAFDNLRIIPPGQGIVHQVNLERLATVVALGEGPSLMPDTVIGTDSHTTMINGIGVLGWGVGGIEAEAILLGLPIRTAVPSIVGVRLDGCMSAGVTATDLALALTQRLRHEGVVGALLEWFGPALAGLATPDRCTIANMAPEYGAMAAFFPLDAETLRYLRSTGRTPADVDRVAAYCRRQSLLRDDASPVPRFGRVIDFDLSTVKPCVAGPNRPYQRIALADLGTAAPKPRPRRQDPALSDGSIVIAAITSCTSTANPASMIAAGLVARNAVRRGLTVPRHVKSSLAPGSRAVTRYLDAAGLLSPLKALGFHVVGYGCATCNGGSGALSPEIAAAVERDRLCVAAVLSGNRNFEGRIHPQVRDAFLASPPLVVALSLVGHIGVDLTREPVGIDRDGAPVLLSDLWPNEAEVRALIDATVTPDAYRAADEPSVLWRGIEVAAEPCYAWRDDSTYIRRPPYFDGETSLPKLIDAPVLLALGDDVTTDHISPVGAIAPDSPAGRYLRAHGVEQPAFNSYGSRRGNHEVMARATFGGVPGGAGVGDAFDSSRGHSLAPQALLAGRNYGMGSSRDWAARGPWFLGVRVVLAESFERIHRANLIAMGILPIALPASQGALGLTGDERFTIDTERLAVRGALTIVAHRSGAAIRFTGVACVDSDDELSILRRGGMLPYLLDRFKEIACA